MQRILTKREKIVLYTTVAVIIFSIGFNFLGVPVLSKFEQLNREINLNRVKLKKCLRLLSQKDYIQARYSQHSAAVSLLGARQDASINTLSEIETLAKDAGIRIIDIRPQAQRGSGRYKETIVDLKVEGAMEGHLKFIYDIEASAALLTIKRLQLNTKPNSPLLEGIFTLQQISSPD